LGCDDRVAGKGTCKSFRRSVVKEDEHRPPPTVVTVLGP
jgi:hypothetical protein